VPVVGLNAQDVANLPVFDVASGQTEKVREQPSKSDWIDIPVLIKARVLGRSVVVTHIDGCRSRLRLPCGAL
jgi:hypothetical protein